MRVLHVHSGNLYGGVETFLATLARARRHAADMEMSVALCFDGRIACELRDAGVRVADLGEVRLRRPDAVWRARRRLAELLDREPADAVVCHQAWPLAIFGPVARAAGVPLMQWVHMAQSRHWLERLAARVPVDGVICNSRFTASTLMPTGARVEWVYYPIEAPVEADPAERTRVRRELGVASGEAVIVQVSRMESLKGHALLLQALGSLRAYPGWTCWIVGGAQRQSELEYVASLRAAASELHIRDRVQFLGHRPDAVTLLRGADILCQPNLQPEGFGITFVEAMDAGIPVVTSAIGGALEVVDEQSGVLLPAGDVGRLGEVLGRLISDEAERRRLGQHGRRRARELCDPATQTRRIAVVLEQLARQGAAC